MHLNKYDFVHVENAPQQLREAHGEKWYYVEVDTVNADPLRPIYALCRAGCREEFERTVYRPPKMRVAPFLTPIPGSVAIVINTTGQLEPVFDIEDCRPIEHVTLEPFEFNFPDPDANRRYRPHERVPFREVVLWWGRCPKCGAVHFAYRIGRLR